MAQDILGFVTDALRGMNYDVSGVTEATDLGPAGLGVESLAVAELAVLVEDEFGVTFSDEDASGLAGMTLGELAAEVASRVAVLARGVGE